MSVAWFRRVELSGRGANDGPMRGTHLHPGRVNPRLEKRKAPQTARGFTIGYHVPSPAHERLGCSPRRRTLRFSSGEFIRSRAVQDGIASCGSTRGLTNYGPCCSAFILHMREHHEEAQAPDRAVAGGLVLDRRRGANRRDRTWTLPHDAGVRVRHARVHLRRQLRKLRVELPAQLHAIQLRHVRLQALHRWSGLPHEHWVRRGWGRRGRKRPGYGVRGTALLTTGCEKRTRSMAASSPSPPLPRDLPSSIEPSSSAPRGWRGSLPRGSTGCG
jgi:hypothetical protein